MHWIWEKLTILQIKSHKETYNNVSCEKNDFREFAATAATDNDNVLISIWLPCGSNVAAMAAIILIEYSFYYDENIVLCPRKQCFQRLKMVPYLSRFSGFASAIFGHFWMKSVFLIVFMECRTSAFPSEISGIYLIISTVCFEKKRHFSLIYTICCHCYHIPPQNNLLIISMLYNLWQQWQQF